MPTSVSMLLGGYEYAMTETEPDSGTYTGTIPDGWAVSGPLSIQAICETVNYVLTVGEVVVYTPMGAITDAITGAPIDDAEVTLHQVPNWTSAYAPEDSGPMVCEFETWPLAVRRDGLGGWPRSRWPWWSPTSRTATWRRCGRSTPPPAARSAN